MSKPLELIVYSTWTAVDGTVHCSAFQHDGFPIPVDMVVREKRLTDAELAAEYWAQDSKCRHEQWIETVRGDGDYEAWERVMQSRMYEQLTALHRFATLPHYDEAVAA